MLSWRTQLTELGRAKLRLRRRKTMPRWKLWSKSSSASTKREWTKPPSPYPSSPSKRLLLRWSIHILKYRENKRATVHLSRTNLLTTSRCSMRARSQLNLPTRRKNMNSVAFDSHKAGRRTEDQAMTLVMRIVKRLDILTKSTVSECAK